MNNVENTYISNQKSIFNLLEKISGYSHILTIPKVFIQILDGDHGQALFLSQLLYWSDKGKQENGWFYKSYTEWYDETLLSEYQVRKATKVLKQAGIIDTKLKKANGTPTVHYRVNPNALYSWILKKLQNPLLKNLRMETEKTTESITEITPKITTKDSLYIMLPHDENFLSLYLDLHEEYLHKEHVRVTEDQKDKIENDISEIISNGIEFEEWESEVRDHFETLPAANNGNIIAFLTASMRHFTVHLEY